MEVFGVLGIVFIQGSNLLQIFKFLKTKRTEGVSIGFWWAVVLGLVCYEIYAIYIQDPIYICSNLIGITLSSTSIFLYYKFRGHKL